MRFKQPEKSTICKKMVTGQSKCNHRQSKVDRIANSYTKTGRIVPIGAKEGIRAARTNHLQLKIGAPKKRVAKIRFFGQSKCALSF
jgi:hypothetical protein